MRRDECWKCFILSIEISFFAFFIMTCICLALKDNEQNQREVECIVVSHSPEKSILNCNGKDETFTNINITHNMWTNGYRFYSQRVNMDINGAMGDVAVISFVLWFAILVVSLSML